MTQVRDATPSIGDVVLYHFTSYKTFGSPEQEIRTRPAIVTSIDPFVPASGVPAINLHVFFEDGDFVTPAQRDFRESWGPRSMERRGVPPSHTGDYGHTDNTWSSKPSKPVPVDGMRDWARATGGQP